MYINSSKTMNIRLVKIVQEEREGLGGEGLRRNQQESAESL